MGMCPDYETCYKKTCRAPKAPKAEGVNVIFLFWFEYSNLALISPYGDSPTKYLVGADIWLIVE